MKIILGLFALLALTSNLFASPLIYSQKFNSQDEIKISKTLDLTKYKQIRILVKYQESFTLIPNQEKYFADISFLTKIGDEQAEINGREKQVLPSGKKFTLYSETIDSPPDNLTISVGRFGIFWVYVWGTQ